MIIKVNIYLVEVLKLKVVIILFKSVWIYLKSRYCLHIIWPQKSRMATMKATIHILIEDCS